MKPFLKWAGGKRRLLDQLRSRLPGEFRTYAEPFVGGAALFFALAGDAAAKKRLLSRAILSDQNEELVTCYRAIQRDVEAVIRVLKTYRYDADVYYETREIDSTKLSDPERAARLIFLNRTCFNGLWRVNSKGKFNVPFGRYKNPRICDEPTLRDASRALQKAELIRGDFTTATRKLESGDFVYFDPPYQPVTKTASFTAYAAEGFSDVDQKRLRDELVRLKKKGVYAMLSNADTAETRSLYEGFTVHLVFAPRAINCDTSKRGDVGELIVTTWGEPGIQSHAEEKPPRRGAA